MFTGIITDIGRVVAVERRGDVHFTVATRFDLDEVAIGASIACSGVCLTVTEKTTVGGEGAFLTYASPETLSKTTLGDWREGTPVNLERALRLGDELGGHIVSGHIDGVAELVSVQPDGESMRLLVRPPAALFRLVAPKGSVALDGVSLTVNEVRDDLFGINVIPHTLEHTTLGGARAGSRLNIEVDMLARYVARLTAAG